MTIQVITPDDWKMVPASERGAPPTAKMLGMLLSDANPCLFLLEEPPNYYTAVHSHSEPEVIVILEGRMMFNGKWVGPGTVVQVPANEDYWHATGEQRCVVALMRPTTRGKIRRAIEQKAPEPVG
jgi:hypothetical protein